MAGEKSHTANHPIGIRESRETNRTMVDGSGNRGRRVNLRVVVVGSMIIRNAPFVHSVSVLCPSRFQQNPQVFNPCVLPVMEISRNSGLVSPKVTLLHSYWLQRTRSIGLGGILSRRSCKSAQGKTKTKITDPEQELAQKESEYNKASANERLLEKKLQKSTETVEKLRKQLQDEQDIFERLGPALAQAKEKTKQLLDDLRVMRIAVHGAAADGDKNTPRPVPMEQDTDLFRQKIRLLNESAKRARTESNSDHSGLLECVDGLLGEANALFLKNSNADIINIDPCL